ncbi:MAG: VCBS repeat-containing protein [Gemmataceae bacterium]
MRDAGEVWVFTNNGDGTFRRGQVIAVGAGATGLSLAPAADGGPPDLLVGNGAGDVLRLVGNGDGTFDPPPPVTGTRAPIAVQAVGGGPVALVANQRTNRVTVQTREAGAFAPVGTLTAEDAGAQLAPGDVTWYPLARGGARADAVVLASGSNSVLVYRATGTAADGTPTFAAPASYPTGTNPVHVTIADVNGDAVPDMLVANAGSNDVSVLFGSYGAGGRWVGTAGPRLRAAGAGPLSADLVANPASPGGSDLTITTRDGKVTVLPGRGQGCFDDRSPRVLDLGAALAPQAPSYIPGLPAGYVVTAGGDVIRFNATTGTQAVVSTGQPVLLVQAVDFSRVIEVRSGGGVVLATAGGGSTDLAPRGAVAGVPSGLAVVDFASAVLEVLVTSAGDDAIFEYAVRTGSGGVPITFEITSDLTAVDTSSPLVPTLVTTISAAGGGRGSASATGFGLLDAAAAAGLPAEFLARLGELTDDEVLASEGESFIAALASTLSGEADGDPTHGPRPAETTRDEFLDGTADALKRLVEEAGSGRPPATSGEPAPDGPTLLERLLDALRKLPTDGPPTTTPAGDPSPPSSPLTTPPGEPDGPGEVPAVPEDQTADESIRGPVDWRVVAIAACLLLGATALLHDPDNKAVKPSVGPFG